MNKNAAIQIDVLKIEDIPSLIDCVRRCYGDSYPFKTIYSQSALEDLLKSELMHSVVAKDSNNAIIGHGSLTFSNLTNSSPELGKLFIDPEYRGRHIADQLANKLLELTHKLELHGFWSECVTNHPYSQDVLITAGGVEVGLLLGEIPATIKMQGEHNFNDSRMSLLAFYVPGIKPTSLDIFVPESHASLIRSIALDAKHERTISTAANNGNGKTECFSDTDQFTLISNIKITHIGADFKDLMQNEIGRLENLNLSSIYIDLPICNQAAVAAYLELEKLGFFFSSWLPHFVNGQDILRLQKIYTTLNESEIICAREAGKTMKKYVLSEWHRVSTGVQRNNE